MNRLQLALVAGGAAALGGCAQSSSPYDPTDLGYDGTGIAFTVAPLTLDSLADACYSFTIQNGQGQLVVGRGPEAQLAFPADIQATSDVARSLCASQFGNGAGGDISYVAPCDAQTTPDGNAEHTVTLWVDALCASPLTTAPPDPMAMGASLCGEIQSYVDPCPTGCDLKVTCEENADTPVTFNFTIMGQADQGFFDIAVNFDDIFCSAKLDDCNTAGDRIRLMFDADGNRINTIVAAVACTAGPGDAVDTHLSFSRLMVQCGAEGPHYLSLGGLTQEGNLDIGPFPSAVYYGTESLSNVNKVFTNVAIGVGDFEGCSVQWQVTASDGALDVGDPAEYNSFGMVNFEGSGLNQSDFDTGAPICQENPLNGDLSAVTTFYVNPGNIVSVIGFTAELKEDSTEFGNISVLEP